MMLEVLHDEIKKCKSCSLCELMPFLPVPGIGPNNAKIAIVGEAPGEDESIAEEPFVGQCGRMLDLMLKAADINRENCYICNVVNCRPVKVGKRISNRPPTKDEINSCKGWLFKQLELVRPKVVFTLGKVPTSTLLGLKSSITLSGYIGNQYNKDNMLVIPVWHPSYLMQYSKDKVNLAIEIFKKGAKYAD